MSFSARSRYGTRALMELALQGDAGPVSLETLARNQDMPLRYLSKIAQDLKRAGLVRSVRGARGGYVMTRDPADIEIMDIVRAMDGSVALVDCVDDPAACERGEGCVTRELWGRVNEAMQDVLKSATLKDLVDKERARRRAVARASKVAKKRVSG